MPSPSKNILWLTISRIISLVLLFLAYTQLFRYLGPYTSGQFQFILSYVTLFGVVIDFGIQQYIIKKISEKPEHAKRYFHNFLAVEIVLAILVYAVMVGVAYLNNYDFIVIRGIMIAGFAAAIFGLTYPFLAVMSAFYDLRRVAVLNFISSVINVTIIFITIQYQYGIMLLVSQQMIYAVVAVVLYYRFIQRHIPKPDILKAIGQLDFSLIKQIMIAALPFALLVGFSTVYNRIDIVLITKILGYTDTGLYTAAYKFFDLLAFFPAVVSHSLYPVFTSLIAQHDLTHVRHTLERYLRFMVALALPIGVGGSILARPIISILAGPQFIDAAPALAILVWAPAVLCIYIVMNAIVISQLTKFAMAITGANVVVNVAGNLLLLPIVGIRGAAIMTLVSEFLQGAFYFYFVRTRITDFTFFRFFAQPLVAATVMGFVVWSIRSFEFLSWFGIIDHRMWVLAINLMVIVAVGAFAYISILLLIRFFKKDDIMFVKSLINRGYGPAQTIKAG